MLEVSLAHIVGASKKYLAVTSKQSTNTRARQTHLTASPVYSLMLSITRTMVLIISLSIIPPLREAFSERGLNLATV
jgi:hypothetical protein